MSFARKFRRNQKQAMNRQVRKIARALQAKRRKEKPIDSTPKVLSSIGPEATWPTEHDGTSATG